MCGALLESCVLLYGRTDKIQAVPGRAVWGCIWTQGVSVGVPTKLGVRQKQTLLDVNK